MQIKGPDKWKMAFKSRYDYSQYLVILFRLINLPAIFQGYSNKILVEKLNVFMIMHLNNILIYIKNKRKEYIEAVQLMLDQLQKYLLSANFTKFQFH